MKRLADELANWVKKKARNEDGASAQIVVKPSDVPVYLRESEFYRSLDMEENGEFSIPANHMKANTIVETLQDACDLLQTVRFWGLNISLMPIFDYAITQPFGEIENELQALEDEIAFVGDMLHVLKNKNSIEEMIGAALKRGNMELVRFLCQREPSIQFSQQSAFGGSIDCVQRVLNQRQFKNIPMLEVYVANGQLTCLRYLEKQLKFVAQTNAMSLIFGSPPDTMLPILSVMHDQLKCLKYLHACGLPMDGCVAEAAAGGHVACFKYLVDQKFTFIGNEKEYSGSFHKEQVKLQERMQRLQDIFKLNNAYLDAARIGSLSQLKKCMEYGGEWHLWTCHAAALNGHLHILQYAHEHGCPLLFPGDSPQLNCEYCNRFDVNERPSHLVEMVAQRKHWECTRYLIQQQHPLTPGLAPQLAYNKQDDLLRLAVAHGCQLPTEVAVIYARRGYLENLVFVLEHGCPPSSQIPWGAARCGRLPCLVYAHEHGCALDEFVCVGAARGGHLDCLQYAYKHGCRWGEEVCKAAVKGGSAECVQFAREHVVVEEDEETTSGEEER